MTAVQLSPCVGGRIRTWGDDGTTGLWSVPNDAVLRENQATGRLPRIPRGERLSGEAAELAGDGSALVIRPRFPVQAADGLTMEAQTVELAEPRRRASRATFEDFREVLTRAVEHCAAKYEFLVVRRGGIGAPDQPFCLFAVLPDGAARVSVVETAPAPAGSTLWEPFLDPAAPSQTMSAPFSPETVTVVPTLMTEAIGRWDLDPWDLAFSFGQP
ncbi:hypothetical protein [Tsukamurella sp. 1534]|uniref:hypothetical protein n=1 Tax=Tsukamurella sp. 1534 TaxID=1151061 RepID=UPI0002ED5ACB|nr:hypothetical protein [Tsukamurella sp. 1534]